MGRPINKKFIGNTTGSGQQIVATAYIPGSAGPTTAWLQKQVATNTYNMANVAGVDSGRCQLVQGGVDLQPGQANITVTPYGSSGTGVVVGALMGIDTAASNVFVSGPLDVNVDYNVGKHLTPAGGTYTQQANLVITEISAGYVSFLGTNHGQDYDAGNYIEFGGAGWVSNLRIAINSVDAGGAITGFTALSGPGFYGIRNAAIGPDPLSGGTTYTGSGIDANGTGAEFNVQWGAHAVSVVTPGKYSVLPGTTNTATTSADSTGNGATVDLTWKVTDTAIANGGSDFDQGALVAFSSGTAAALATVNAAGSISSVTVTASGSGYTTVPSVTVSPLAGVQYAAEIRDNTVTTFDNNTYLWVTTNVDLTQSNQARIQTA